MTKLRWMILAAVLGATLVRLAGVADENLWIDEVHSIHVATGPPLRILERMSETGDKHPPLYYFLLSLWLAAFGDSDVAIRSLSVVLGALAVGMAGLMAREVLPGREGAVLATAALSPVLVFYSQEARMYALVTLLAAICLWLFLIGPSSWSRRLALAAVTALLLFSHHVGLFFGGGLGLMAMVWPGLTRRDRLERALPLLAGLVAFSPWFLVMRTQWEEIESGMSWNLLGGLPLRVMRLVPFLLVGDLPPSIPGRPVQIAAAVLAAAGTLVLLRSWDRGARMLLAAIGIPVAGVVVLSMASAPFFHRRYFCLLALPAVLVLVAGCGVGRGASRGLLAALLLLFAGVDGVQIFAPRNVDMKGVLASLEGRLPQGGTLYHIAPSALPQEGFLLGRHYGPHWRHCFVQEGGRAFSGETRGFIPDDACFVPSMEEALQGSEERVFVLLTGMGVISDVQPDSPLASGVTPTSSVEAVEAMLPPDWRIGRQETFHLARLLELVRVTPTAAPAPS